MERFHQSPNIYVGEVNLKVLDLQKMTRFYQEFIGFRVLERSDDRTVLTADGKTPLLTLERPADVVPRAERTAGLYHFAILLPSRADLSAFLRHLLESDYPMGAADHAVSEALYISDPEGNGIEVYRDRPSSEWTWDDNNRVHMVTDPLDVRGILAESDAPWTGLPEEAVMEHIHLHVGDLEAAEEFYARGLGFDVVSYYPQAAFLSTGRYHHHIAVNTWQGTGIPNAPGDSAGLNWYSLIFPDQEAVDQAADRLRRIGAPVKPISEGYLTSDPSGNRIRLVVPD